MRSLVEWIKEPGYHITRGWDVNEGWIGPAKLELFSHQERILAHAFTPGPDGKLPYTTVVYSTIKKSGKTELEAAIGQWYADQAPPNSEIYVCANDLEHGQSLAFANMRYDSDMKGYKTYKEEIRYPNGTTARVLAKEHKSAAGRQCDLTLWDELWGFDSDRGVRMWSELTLTPTAKYPLRVVVTYAGYENDDPNLLYDLYNHIVKKGKPVPELADIVDRNGDPVCFVSEDGRSFAYWDTEPRMPWQTPDYYAQEAGLLPPMQFLRLHRNQWVTSEEQYIPIEWWDAAVERGTEAGLTGPLHMMSQDNPFRNYPVSLAIDVGVKQDCSAAIGTYYDVKRGRIGLACSSIWTPPKGGTLDLEETVEAYIVDMHKKMKVISIPYDKTNFHRSMTTLKKMRFPMNEFSQQPGSMTKASKALYDALRNGTLEAYPDPQLRDHLKYAVAKASSTGYRISKEKNAKYKIDGAVALAMSVYDAIERAGVDTSRPIRIESPYSEDTQRFGLTRPRQRDDESWLPGPLRSKVY